MRMCLMIVADDFHVHHVDLTALVQLLVLNSSDGAQAASHDLCSEPGQDDSARPVVGVRIGTRYTHIVFSVLGRALWDTGGSDSPGSDLYLVFSSVPSCVKSNILPSRPSGSFSAPLCFYDILQCCRVSRPGNTVGHPSRAGLRPTQDDPGTCSRRRLALYFWS
ncbi:hypothetical protein BD310DRAFT_343024 [Dichomitus squalens]|uniref:Uncharacterized protein n=1 Tax=Dichomitus squalens TaxID=114155 RepID=A0A4Q9PET3_9APHY|nr:hypothetical protein BD310DRAFT_343024 [Dichomitus squalens]